MRERTAGNKVGVGMLLGVAPFERAREVVLPGDRHQRVVVKKGEVGRKRSIDW